jgi:hypothetical protein
MRSGEESGLNKGREFAIISGRERILENQRILT